MSSTLHSPPETPSKLAMAVNGNARPRTPVIGGPSQLIGKTVNPLPGSEEAGQEGERVQVPSSIPHHNIPHHHSEDRGVNGHAEAKSDDDLGHLEVTAADDRTEEADDYGRQVEDTGISSDLDLPPMDWADFEEKYKEAINATVEEEAAIGEEFNKLVESFDIWTQHSAQTDNNRAWKRIKTRQRYVELSEQALKDKKKHYESVVQAFKAALALLGQ